jgi:hypothetical protein
VIGGAEESEDVDEVQRQAVKYPWGLADAIGSAPRMHCRRLRVWPLPHNRNSLPRKSQAVPAVPDLKPYPALDFCF